MFVKTLLISLIGLGILTSQNLVNRANGYHSKQNTIFKVPDSTVKLDKDLEIPVKLSVLDENGNHDKCQLNISTLDYQVKITMINLDNKAIEKFTTQSFRNNSLEQEFFSNCSNTVLIEKFYPSLSYSFKFAKYDSAKNGIDILDLIYIQKHILGIRPLDQANLFAADVNNSSSISAVDISEMTKVILGLLNEFRNKTNWYFTEVSKFKINEFFPCEDSCEFIAIKIGDINRDALTRCDEKKNQA
ncbi:MAG: dockerin type I repeat-containing protein [Bacteroidota bacterium]|nr:dockerin type I repeat-containing protein [Bacteroidota bacterium]